MYVNGNEFDSKSIYFLKGLSKIFLKINAFVRKNLKNVRNLNLVFICAQNTYFWVRSWIVHALDRSFIYNKYIMIGLERTNMAIYTYVTKNLLEHSKYEY